MIIKSLESLKFVSKSNQNPKKQALLAIKLLCDKIPNIKRVKLKIMIIFPENNNKSIMEEFYIFLDDLNKENYKVEINNENNILLIIDP